MNAKKLNIVLLLTFIFVVSCDAPHNNPLDPDNPGNNLAVITGKIQTEKLPRVPLSEVNISWIPEGITIQSNSNGDYSFQNISRKNGWIKFSKSGFMDDSFFVDWGSIKSITVNKFLNSVPQIIDLKIYSIVLNKFPADQTSQLVVELEVTDDENDVDSVFIYNNDLEIIERLNEVTKSVYRRTFSLIDLKISSLDQIIGKELSITVQDVFGNRFSVGSSNLKRIIKQEVETLTPKNNEDSVSVTPELKWRRFLPGFDFSYIIQIYTNEVSPQLVYSKSDISKDDILLQVESPISGNAQGEYFWVVWAVDEFGNRTRSKPATFKVLQ